MEIQFAEPKRGKMEKWQPKKWKVKYEQMVALHCAGWTNDKIAELFHMTPQQIMNVVTCEKAEEIKKKAIESIRGTVVNGIPERINKLQEASVALAESAMRNMQIVMDNIKLTQDSPFAVFDRSQKVLEGVGVLKTKDVPPAGGSIVNNNQRTSVAVLSMGEADNLANALKLSAEATQKHPIPIQQIPLVQDE